MKICKMCEDDLPLDCFSFRGGLPISKCKKCICVYSRDRNRTKNGLCIKIYYAQRSSSTTRKHPMPSYTRDWLVNWIKSQSKFDSFYSDWVASGYDKKLRPSVDRIEDSKPYTKNNIQLLTWEENNLRYLRGQKGTIINKGRFSKPVIQLDLDGWMISTYRSTAEAARSNGVSQCNVSNVCIGNAKKASGYIWKFI